MHFAYPWVLSLLVPVVLFSWFWIEKSKLPAIKLTLPRGTQQSQKNLSFPMNWVQGVLKSLAMICCVIALARPQSVLSTQERHANGIDIVMVLDVSLSMLIQDMGDRSRMEIARETFKDFILGRQNDRIGLVMFSGEPITLAPPTLDYGMLLQQVTLAEPGTGLRDGTAIGDGLALAINRLKRSDAKSRVIILLTDGDNNVGRIDPLTAGDLALGYGIKVYSIAIGTEGRVRQPLPQQTPLGKTYIHVWVDNRLNPKLLEDISEKTNGRFWRVTDEKTLTEVFKEIDQLEKTEIQTEKQVQYEELFQSWIAICIGLLIVERALSLGIWRQWA